MKLSKELQKKFQEFLLQEELKQKKSKKVKETEDFEEIEEEQEIKPVKKQKKTEKVIENNYVKRLEKPLKNSKEYSKSLDMIYNFFKENYKEIPNCSHYKTLSIFTYKNRIYSFGKKHVLCEYVKTTGKKSFTVLLNVSRPSSHTGLQTSFIRRVIEQYREKGFTIKIKEVNHI